jgi:hypothetical protein
MTRLAQLLNAKALYGEAGPLMRRAVEILVASTARTGHEHPNLRAALNNYSELLQAMGWSENQIAEASAKLLEYGSEITAS